MNWREIIGDLLHWKYSQSRIAQACGCTQATVSDIYRGITPDPKFAVGLALVELHKRAAREAKRRAKADERQQAKV